MADVHREHYFELPVSDRADVLQSLAPVMGRRAEILEKDIWLCQVLDVLFQLPCRKPMAFKRAREVYDWAAIIPQYEALWAQLNKIRQAQAKDLKPLPHPWPARMDPFHAFAAYPTQTLTEQTLLALVDADVDTAIARTLAYRQLAMIDFAKAVLPSEAEIRQVIQAAATGPKAAAALIAGIPAERQPFVFRSLVWLVKLGILGLAG